MTQRLPDGGLDPQLVLRLVALDKDGQGGIRPVGVGEAFRRLVLKAVGRAVRGEVMSAAGSAQICAGHSSACEAACHSFQGRFTRPDTQMLLLVDASNAFNKMNRRQALAHHLRAEHASKCKLATAKLDTEAAKDKGKRKVGDMNEHLERHAREVKRQNELMSVLRGWAFSTLDDPDFRERFAASLAPEQNCKWLRDYCERLAADLKEDFLGLHA
eukprot:NODE_641_length_1887_cov_7.216540_g335_i1.p1 GENE.NODE_641_length_1887_cov_7.216540_g335_i1~~NODE_641_length_1887_cov_7.216540_g335_i1.p1  ORF type:complete len:215 (+),score=33.50 NODE_641_length_1887_cov_7.216540_g335_i1:793-1437(+)